MRVFASRHFAYVFLPPFLSEIKGLQLLRKVGTIRIQFEGLLTSERQGRSSESSLKNQNSLFAFFSRKFSLANFLTNSPLSSSPLSPSTSTSLYLIFLTSHDKVV
jgi:hypothetical protein